MRRRDSAPSAEQLDGVVDCFRGKRVLVLADLVADEFLYGSVQRVSREAPVLILQYDTTDVRLGGGANAVHNIATLGGVPIPVGCWAATSTAAACARSCASAGISAAQVATDPAYVTPVKTRCWPAASTRPSSRWCASTRPRRLSASSPARRAVARAVRAFRGPLDAVLVSDYGFGW